MNEKGRPKWIDEASKKEKNAEKRLVRNSKQNVKNRNIRKDLIKGKKKKLLQTINK